MASLIRDIPADPMSAEMVRRSYLSHLDGFRRTWRGWVATMFFIPVLNIWWPYQSAVDMLPPEHPGRAVIRRWWMLWIAFWIGFWAEIAAAFQSVTLLAIVTGITVVLAVLAAMAARAVVSEITDAHASRLARA